VALEHREHRAGELGQASVELLAVLPALLVCALIAAHALSAGWALWSAASAARSGARAEYVGRDPERSVRRALPGRLRDGAEIQGGESIQVSVEVPALVPGWELPPVRTATALDPGDR